MIRTLAAVAALALLSVPAATLAAPAPTAVQAATLSANSPIKDLLANPATKAIIDARLPGLSAHPALPQFENSTLAQIMPMSGGRITPEVIAAIQADIDALQH